MVWLGRSFFPFLVCVVQIVPEQNVPVADAIPLSSIPMLDRARLACNTAKFLEGLKGDKEGRGDAGNANLETSDTSDTSDISAAQTQAREAFKAFTENKGLKAPSMSVLATYPNASLVHLDRMLSEYDHELINSAVRIREYTKNKLLVESENPDGKIRIRALELLGKMKDVGLFTDRIEVTHKTKTDEELEAELHKKLERYMGNALVVGDAGDAEDVEDVGDAGDVGDVDDVGGGEDGLLDASALIDKLNK